MDTLSSVKGLILSAAPTYEMYLFQVMGRPFHLKLPVEKPNPDQLVFTFESMREDEYATSTEPQRVVLKVEYLRSMKMVTLRMEWWPDIEAAEPKAVNEPKIAKNEDLLSPHYIFGWLKKVVCGWAGDIGVDNLPEARMRRAETLIQKTDELLADIGYFIEADGYVEWANTLNSFVFSGKLDEQTENVLSKVDAVVREASRAYAAAKGIIEAKQRWRDFSEHKAFEEEFRRLDTPELLALEAMVELMAAGELEEGTRFKALVAKLKARGNVRDPAALAAWIGRRKYGAEKFAKMAAAGRRKRMEAAKSASDEAPKTGQVVGTVVGDFRRLAGVVNRTGSWKLP